MSAGILTIDGEAGVPFVAGCLQDEDVTTAESAASDSAAIEAIEALAIYRHDPLFQERLRKVVAASENLSLREAYDRGHELA